MNQEYVNLLSQTGDAEGGGSECRRVHPRLHEAVVAANGEYSLKLAISIEMLEGEAV
jgi:hypothetical protein